MHIYNIAHDVEKMDKQHFKGVGYITLLCNYVAWCGNMHQRVHQIAPQIGN